MEVFVAIFMVAMAVGIAAIWTLDIRAGRGFVSEHGLVWARDPENGNRMMPHWLAEYGTAAGLLLGASALMLDSPNAALVAAAALGALAYTSLNSLAWVLARPERRPYGIPMIVGLVGGLAGLFLLALM